LIIKLDEIGDYILFRDFIKIIRESKKFNDYKISLLGNEVWKEITEAFDKNFVDDWIWVDKKKFLNNLFYRRSFLKKVNEMNFGIAVNFHISRNFYLDDAVINAVNANNKIGHKTNLTNMFNWQRRISDGYYTNLVDIEEVVFEFEKNKNFLESLLSEKINLAVPYLDVEVIDRNNVIKKNNVVLFIGSRRAYYRWAIENFVRIVEHIIKKYNSNILLIGSVADIKYANKFKSLIKASLLSNILDLTGKTSLIETIEIVSKTQLTISNDSGMAHISAATGTPTIVLLNGSRFGRFFPYPENSSVKVIPIYPPKLDNYKINFSEFVREYKYKSKLDINSISPERVTKEIDNFLGENST